MQATDRILLLNHYNLLMKDEKNQPLWRNKKILIIQDAILFFEPDINVSSGELSSIFYNELYRMLLINTDARLVTEANAKAINMDMSMVPEVPESDDAVIQLIDHKTKTIKLISCKSEAEAETLISAFKAGRIWSLYYIFLIKQNIKPNTRFLDWLIETINSTDYIPLILEPVDVFGVDYNEEVTESVLEFLKHNNLIKTLILKNFELDDLEGSIIFQILTSVTGHQIKELSLISSKLNIESLKILSPGISHHTHLCKLDLSNNEITDDGLSELASIFPSITALVEINLSNNLIVGKPEKLEEFLVSAQQNLEDLKINLSRNRIEDQSITILQISLFYAEEIKINDLDLSFNRFSNEGYYKLYEAYRQGKNKGKFKLKIYPIPFHKMYLQPVFQEKKTNMNILLERITFLDKEKKAPCSKQWINEVKKIVRNIITIRGQSLSIERLATICHEIYDLEYEFPNKKLDELRDIVWDLINRAIDIEDYYSVTILQICAQKIGLDLHSLTPQLKIIKNKINSISKRIIRVINFNLPEAEINKDLDELIIDIYKYDLRGSLVDTLLSIKEKRDEFIKKMINSNYKEDINDEEIMNENLKDPFWFLESDLEYAKGNSLYMDDLNGFDNNLFVHPNNLNYFELSKLSQEKLEKDLNVYKEKISFREQSYYLVNLCNRSLFLLADHVFKFYLNVWKFSKGDLKLNCARIVIQYNNFSKRRELCSLLDPRPSKPQPLSFIQQNYQTPDNLFSFQIDNEMTKYIHLRSLEGEKGDSFHKQTTNDSQSPGTAFRQHRPGITLEVFNPATVKNGGILSELVNDKSAIKDREKFGFQKTILDYTPGILLSSLRKAKSEGFNKDAISLNEKIHIIMTCKSEIEEEKLPKSIQELLEKLASSRNHYDIDNEPDALVDEIYLQLYRYSNRFQEARANYNQILIFKLLCILSLYMPPSEDLQDHLRAWIFSKMSEQSIDNFIRKTLINLSNHDDPDFIKPSWIPSLIEIKERLKGEKELSISFKFCDEVIGSLLIHDFETVEEFMNKLYESQYLKKFDDKYAFWIYRAKTSKEEDVALLNDEVILEVLSLCDDNTNFLLVQRRITCSVFPLNYNKLDELHLDSFFYQIKRNYIVKDKYSDFCKAESIAKLAAILYIIDRGKKSKKIIVKSEKIQKKIKTLIPDSWIIRLSPILHMQKIIPHLMQSNLINQDIWTLKQEFLNGLKSYYLLTGVHYDCQIQDSLSGTNARVDMMLNVNVFGLFFYKVRDKPVRTIYYEELVYAVGSEYECSLFYVEKESFLETRLNIFCKNNRARELNEDIVSYCILRTKEKSRLLYGLAFLNEFKYRFAGKSTAIKIKKKEEDDEDEEEWNEEQKKANAIDQEIADNEIIFLIDKYFAFHYEFPYYSGFMPNELKNPIPRSKKTKRETFKFTEKGESIEVKSEAQSIIEGLRKPKTLKDEDDGDDTTEKKNKEIKGILKKVNDDMPIIREKKKTLIKEDLDHQPKLTNSIDPQPKLTDSLISNNSADNQNSIPPPPPPNKQPTPPKFSMAMIAKMKSKAKQHHKNIHNEIIEENEEKTEKGNKENSSDSENDYADDIKMKPKIHELQPINNATKANLKIPPPPRKATVNKKESPERQNSSKSSSHNDGSEFKKPLIERYESPKEPAEKPKATIEKIEIPKPPPPIQKYTIPPPPPPKKTDTLKATEKNDTIKPPPLDTFDSTKAYNPAIETIESPQKLSKKKSANHKPPPLTKLNSDDKSEMKFTKNDDFQSKKDINQGYNSKKDKTPKAQDLKNLDVKSLLKNQNPTVIKKYNSNKKTSILLEKDPSSPELPKKGLLHLESPSKETGNKQESQNPLLDIIKKNSIKKDPVKPQENIKRESIKPPNKPPDNFISESLKPENIETIKENNNKAIDKPVAPKESPKKKNPFPQNKLNELLTIAMKNQPKVQIKIKKPEISDEDKFFQLNEDMVNSKKKEEDLSRKTKKSISGLDLNKSNALLNDDKFINEKKKSITEQPPAIARKSIVLQEQKKLVDEEKIDTAFKDINEKPQISLAESGKDQIQNIEENDSQRNTGFERRAIRKKTQKSTPSDTSPQEKEIETDSQNLPSFLRKNLEENEENNNSEEKKYNDKLQEYNSSSGVSSKDPKILSNKLKINAQNKRKKFAKN